MPTNATINVDRARRFFDRVKRAVKGEPEPVVLYGRDGARQHISRLKRELDGLKAEAEVITATPEAMVANVARAAELRDKISLKKRLIDRLEFVIALMDLNDERIAGLERQLKEGASAEGDVCARLDAAVQLSKVNDKLAEAKFVAEVMEASDPLNLWEVVAYANSGEKRYVVDESNKEWHITHTLQYIFDCATISPRGRPGIVDRIQA